MQRIRAVIPGPAWILTLLAWLVFAALPGCGGKPLLPYSTDTPPLALLPAERAGIRDARGRFREYACAVLEAHGRDLPHYRDCDSALVRLGEEPAGNGEPVALGPAGRRLVAGLVPGIGWECFESWLHYENEFSDYLARFGYGSAVFRVEGLSGSETNARLIRDQIMARADEIEPGSLVLIGYSKGAPDILTAVVNYPEILPLVAAVVSIAGPIGGSPLANDSAQDQLEMMRHLPDSGCSAGDGKAVESLRPSVRQAWLQDNPLPASIRYYSAVTFPLPDQVSAVLKPSQRKLAAVDPRNDSQVIFYDQVIPGSTLLGYLNADHWAVAVPIADHHPFIGRHFADRNEFPRQALIEALMRFLEEDLALAHPEPGT